jgi:hypothetical protein
MLNHYIGVLVPLDSIKVCKALRHKLLIVTLKSPRGGRLLLSWLLIHCACPLYGLPAATWQYACVRRRAQGRRRRGSVCCDASYASSPLCCWMQQSSRRCHLLCRGLCWQLFSRPLWGPLRPVDHRLPAVSGAAPTISGTVAPALALTVTPAVTTMTALADATAAMVSMPVASVGHLLGEGLAPLPAKLVKKIVALGFVEMVAWLLDETAMEAKLRPQRGPVTDILQWIHYFATFVSTVSTAYTGKTAELMAYMACIVRCHKDYEGPAWELYDRAFRRRAEMTKDLNWSVVNTSLFNLCFGGRAIGQLCLSEHHTTERCPRRVLAWGSTLAYSAAIDGWNSVVCLMPGMATGAGSPITVSRISARSAGLLAMEPGSAGPRGPVVVQWWCWGETPSSGMKGTVVSTRQLWRCVFHLTCSYHVMSCTYDIVMLWMRI